MNLTEIGKLIQLFKMCARGVYLAGEWVKTANDKYDFLGICAKRYLDSIITRHGTIKIMGMQEPIDLLQLYTRVMVLDKPSSWNRYNIDFIEGSFDIKRRRFNNSSRVKDGEQILNSLDKFMLLGKPGAGKSTFMKYTAISSALGKLKVQHIPVLLNLKDFSDKNLPLIKYIESQFDICKFPNAGHFVENGLKDGNILLLLDGLDEISDARKNDIINEIIDFTDKYDKNKFVISCRVAYYNSFFEKFTDVEIADFDLTQIEGFIKSWFHNDARVADQCFSAIVQRPQLSELSSTPLLLTLLCITYEATLSIPDSRSELYKEAVDALLKKWDASRNIERGGIYKSLSIRRKEGLFSEVAFLSFKKGEYFFRERTLVRYVEEYLTKLTTSGKEVDAPDTEGIVKSIEAQHGIFVERSKGIYSFSHLTFQEFFAAKYIVENFQEGELGLLLKESVVNRRWREILLLLSEMLPKADSFLEKLITSPRRLPYNDAKQHVLRLVRDVKVITSNEKSATARIEVILLVLHLTQYFHQILTDCIKSVLNNQYDDGSLHSDTMMLCIETNEQLLRLVIENSESSIENVQFLLEKFTPLARIINYVSPTDFLVKGEDYISFITSISEDIESAIAFSHPYTDSYGALDINSIIGTHLSYYINDRSAPTRNAQLRMVKSLNLAMAVCSHSEYSWLSRRNNDSDSIDFLVSLIHLNEICYISLSGDSVISKHNRDHMLEIMFTEEQLVD